MPHDLCYLQSRIPDQPSTQAYLLTGLQQGKETGEEARAFKAVLPSEQNNNEAEYFSKSKEPKMPKITKPEPGSRMLIQSWSRIYGAVLEADNQGIDSALAAHVDLFPDAMQPSVKEWAGEILNKALSMKQDDLKAIYERCLRGVRRKL